MPKIISEVYREYKIVPNLQMHMLRVAGVASLICDNFAGKVNKEEVITACLLHDMGNIIKYRFERFPEFVEPQGLAYWQSVKDEYVKKYGSHEHEATLKILEELGVSKNIKEIVSVIDFSLIPSIGEKSLETKISTYADSRVSPFGVLPMRERYKEGRERYKDRKDQMPDEKWDLNLEIMEQVEKEIFSQCKIKPSDITNVIVGPVIEKLKEFVVK